MAIVLNPRYTVTVQRPGRSRVAPMATSGNLRRISGGPVRTPQWSGSPSSIGVRGSRVRHAPVRPQTSGRPATAIFRRRRMLAAVSLFTFAVVACLGVRALASRGDVTASIPTVTPLGSEVLYTEVGQDLSGAFVHGPQYYVVQAGDTMWSIASSLTDGNIRSMVQDLIALNGDASIDVGQRLVLPES